MKEGNRMKNHDAISRKALISKSRLLLNIERNGWPINVVDLDDVIDAPALEILPDLNEVRDEVYTDAVAHGLYEGEYDVPELERAAPGLMYRIQDEVREAWNAALDWQQGKEGAKDHVAEELADIIITALSVSGHLGIDIDAAMRQKVDINKKRPYKHKE